MSLNFFCLFMLSFLIAINWGQSEVRGTKTASCLVFQRWGEEFQSLDVLPNSSCWKSTPVLLAILHVDPGCWYSVYPLNHGCPFHGCLNSCRKNCFVTHHPAELLLHEAESIRGLGSRAVTAGLLMLENYSSWEQESAWHSLLAWHFTLPVPDSSLNPMY